MVVMVSPVFGHAAYFIQRGDDVNEYCHRRGYFPTLDTREAREVMLSGYVFLSSGDAFF